jgi:MFS family permease
VILAILVWVYFLQILDKTVLGYGAIFGMTADTHLTGDQYSFLGSIAPIAQLGWQPFSSFLIVRVPHRILMPSLCLGWGIAQASMAACHNYSSLLAARFFLGLFEAGCLPLFSVITSQWYRRAEQPLRVAAWYGTNGLATIVASALSYALGQIHSDALASWQIIFLFVGLVTICTAPVVYYFLDNDIPSARFLTEHEKLQAIERLRANQTGTGNREFKWSHIAELAMEPKTYLWIGLALLLNVGAAVTNTFGPLILQGVGFDKYKTSLLNMPFGAMQFIVILLASWAAQKAKLKSMVLAALLIPVIAGLAVLYVLPRKSSDTAGLLVAYYLLAFLFGGNPLIVSWIVGNTAGSTKKSVIMSLYNAGSSSGNIIVSLLCPIFPSQKSCFFFPRSLSCLTHCARQGPLLFNKKDAPAYHPGLRKVLAIFVTMFAVVFIQLGNLMFLNKLQSRRRVQNGKAAKIKDHSMEDRYVAMDEVDGGQRLGEKAFLDITDGKNDEFTYIY